MAGVHVLVLFYCRYGTTERLALAAGLGAIQAKGDIRLRRLADRADASTIDKDSSWKAAVERMRAEYVEPKAADIAWADAIVFATPADASDELVACLDQLRADGSAAGKMAATIVGADAALLDRLRSACRAASMTVVVPAGKPSREDEAAAMRALGQQVVATVRANEERSKTN